MKRTLITRQWEDEITPVNSTAPYFRTQRSKPIHLLKFLELQFFPLQT